MRSLHEINAHFGVAGLSLLGHFVNTKGGQYAGITSIVRFSTGSR
jgi:hypothetical protein